jgi:hypothetical protein
VKRKTILLSTAATLLFAVTAAGLSTALRADVAATDPYPAGCVSCHVADGPGDLATRLGEMGHKKVGADVASIPGDCSDCHSEEGGFTPLGEAVHFVHFDQPESNPFVTDHGGECLHCHAMDPETGVVTVKSGPKNW